MGQLADASREVFQLELVHGEVNLPIRVDISSLHPANELAQVGATFNHMLNNVETALAARQSSEVKVRKFVADANHELPNPLASIRGYTELSRSHSGDLGSETNFGLSRIAAESARMTKLVNDLLLLARLDNAQPLVTEIVDLTEIVLNAVSDARAASPEHIWQLTVPAEPMLVVGDANQLPQIIGDLLSITRIHTPNSTTTKTSIRRELTQIIIRVVDDGPGIPAEFQQHIFERFAREDEARSHSDTESTRLGLAIVSAVISAHKGRVKLVSHPRHTEFTISLPVLSS